MDLWHVTLATDDRFPLAASEDSLRQIVGRLDATIGRRTLLFNVCDDHLHAVLSGPRPAVGQQAAGLSRSLKHLLPNARMAPARIRPVADRSHLENLVHYLLNQQAHHRLNGDLLWSGSCFLDLVGARLLPFFRSAALFEALPRWTRDDIWKTLGATSRPTIDWERERAGISLSTIVQAGSSAFAAPTTLTGQSAPVERARRGAVSLAHWAGYPPEAVAGFLNIGRRQCERLVAANHRAESDAVGRNLEIRHVAQRVAARG
jgi:hypothetical protein